MREIETLLEANHLGYFSAVSLRCHLALQEDTVQWVLLQRAEALLYPLHVSVLWGLRLLTAAVATMCTARA